MSSTPRTTSPGGLSPAVPPLARPTHTPSCSIDEELRRELGGVDAKLKRPWTQVKYLTQEQKCLVRLSHSGMHSVAVVCPGAHGRGVNCQLCLNLTCVMLQSCNLGTQWWCDHEEDGSVRTQPLNAALQPQPGQRRGSQGHQLHAVGVAQLPRL